MAGAVLVTLVLAALLPAGTLTVVNSTSGWVLASVYMRPAGMEGAEWGPDLLGEEGFIGIGETWSCEVEPGAYDIRIEDSDGDGYQKFDVTVGERFRWKVTLPDMNDPLDAVDPAYTWGG